MAQKELKIRIKPLVEDMLAEVERFSQEVLDLDVPSKPSLLSYDRQQFAQTFLQEEVDEFRDAWNMGDVEGGADALIDLVYVALGRLIEMGIPPGPVFQEVHRANMDKKRGETKRGHACDAVKPEGWKAPDHSWLLSITGNDVAVLKVKPKDWAGKLMWIPVDIDPKMLFARGDVMSTITNVTNVAEPPPEVTTPDGQKLGGHYVGLDRKFDNLAQKKDPLAKPQTALIPYESLAAQADAMAYGAYKKYKPWDWTKGRPFTQLKSSVDHHLGAFIDREDIDPDSGVHHLGCALADIGIMLALQAMGRTDLDDRRPADTVTMHEPGETPCTTTET